MAESRYGMIEKHSWPAKSHHIRYILSHVRAIAVDGAGLASAFLIAKLTMSQTLYRVVLQALTRIAKLPLASGMVMFAINPYHLADDSFLSVNSFHEQSGV